MDLLKKLELKWRILRLMAASAGAFVRLFVDPDWGGVVGTYNWQEIGNILEKIENETTIDHAKWSLLGDKYVSKQAVEADAGKFKFTVTLENGEETNEMLNDLNDEWKVVPIALLPPNSDVYDIYFGSLASDARSIQKKEVMTREVEFEITGEPLLAAGSGDLDA